MNQQIKTTENQEIENFLKNLRTTSGIEVVKNNENSILAWNANQCEYAIPHVSGGELIVTVFVSEKTNETMFGKITQVSYWDIERNPTPLGVKFPLENIEIIVASSKMKPVWN